MFVGRYSAIVWLYIVILVVGLVCFLCVLNHIICDSAFIEIDELIKWLTTHNPIGHFKHPIFGDGINSASYSFNMQSIMEDLLTLCFHIACDVDWIIFGSHFFGKLKFKHTCMPYGDHQLLNDQTLWKNVVLSRK